MSGTWASRKLRKRRVRFFRGQSRRFDCPSAPGVTERGPLGPIQKSPAAETVSLISADLHSINHSGKRLLALMHRPIHSSIFHASRWSCYDRAREKETIGVVYKGVPCFGDWSMPLTFRGGANICTPNRARMNIDLAIRVATARDEIDYSLDILRLLWRLILLLRILAIGFAGLIFVLVSMKVGWIRNLVKWNLGITFFFVFFFKHKNSTVEVSRNERYVSK